MASKIKVTTSKLTGTADRFSEIGKEISTLTRQMTELVTNTSDWVGDASQAYKKKFRELNDDMQKMTKMINEHVTDLKEMAKAYDRTEKANVSAAQALSGEVIS